MEPQIFLSNRLADLEAGAYQTPQQPSTPPASASYSPPFWDVTYASNLTLTSGAGSDWDPLFDDTATATNRVRFRIATAGGELDHPYVGGNAGRRFKIAWESDTPQTITASLSGSRQDDGAGGYIQVKFNGTLYEYFLDSPGGGTAHYYLTLNCAKRNQLVICSQYQPFTTVFSAMLFDGNTARWVNPSDEHGFVRF